MRKLLFEFLTIVILFAGTWYILRQIDWMSVFKIEKITKNTEGKLGDVFWDLMKKTEIEINSETIQSPIDSILNRICIKNNFEQDRIKIHLIRKDEVNAFALPDNNIVVYSGLILACGNEEEFSGVLCHEIAHIEKNHLMHKLVKELGLSVLISMSKGRGNAEIIKEVIKNLSSTAYDRNMERSADIAAVEYMIKADIDPKPFADFLDSLSKNENLPKQLHWISSHPESKERAAYLNEYIKDKIVVKDSILGNLNWDLLKQKIKQDQ